MGLIGFPWRIVALCVVLGLALAGANHFAASIPFTPQWSAKRAAVRADRLEGEKAALERQIEGQAQIAQAVETYHTREVVYRDVTSGAIADARNTPDATTPLEAGLAAVLGRHDRSLCDAGAACPPTAPDAPGGGAGGL